MADFVGLAYRLIDLTLVIGRYDGVDETAWNIEIKNITIIQKKGSIKNERIFDKTKNTLVNIINFGEIMYFKQNRFTNTQSVIWIINRINQNIKLGL